MGFGARSGKGGCRRQPPVRTPEYTSPLTDDSVLTHQSLSMKPFQLAPAGRKLDDLLLLVLLHRN